MRILEASITHFRNLAHVQLAPSAHFTALVGSNGQGKTNALEAIYFAAALRPLRSAPRKALIRAGQQSCRLHLKVKHERTGLSHDLTVILEPGRRRLQRDQSPASTTDFIGHLVVVAFVPDDLDLAKGSPEGRRRFLDRALLNQQPSYLQHALRYQKALKDRNRLLSEGGADDLLVAYDRVLAHEGLEIARRRTELMADLAPRVREKFQHIAYPAPRLDARLQSKVAGISEPNMYTKELSRRRVRDRAMKKTSWGPHLDDITITLDDAPAREWASQGQHRAIALAFKLAELTVLADHLGEAPILLLDDMSSELDHARSQNLFETVRTLDGQVILTSTSDPREIARTLGQPEDLKVYGVEDGALRETP
ncbi:MAG: DNA replication/repair protein RecF [Myxococcota bacterium]